MSADTRWRLLAGAAILAGVVIRLWVATGAGYLGEDGDLLEWRPATDRALREGIHTVYLVNRVHDPALSGRPWQGGWFVNLPPVVLYLRTAAALAARRLDPEGSALWDSRIAWGELEGRDLEERLSRSHTLTRALKLPGIVADALVALALFVAGSRLGSALGFAAAASYSLNPAVVYNTGFWGQADSVWIAFACAGFALLVRGRAGPAACALALATLTKPQALAFVPLAGLLLARRRALAPAALAAGATFVMVFLPFMLHGTFSLTAEAIWSSTFGGEPYLSCGAANPWLLLDGARALGTSDATRLLGPLTARRLGLLVFLASAFAIAWGAAARHDRDLPRIHLAAACTSLAFFAFCTELHENHLIAVLAFLPLAATVDGRLWWILGALTVSIQANLVVFDEFALARVRGILGPALGSVPLLALVAALVQTAALPLVCAIRRSGRLPSG